MRTNHRFCLTFPSCDFQWTTAQEGIQRGDIGLPGASETIHVIPSSCNVSSLPRNLWEARRGPSLPQSTDVLWFSTNYLSSWPMAWLSHSSALECLRVSKTWIASAQSNYSYWLCFHWNASTIFSFSVSRTCFHPFLLGRQLTLQRPRHCVCRTLASMSQTASWLRIT